MTLFQELVDKAGVRVVTSRRIVPVRSKVVGPRTGGHLPQAARQAADCFWRNANQLARIVYIKIDERYPDRATDKMQARLHAAKMDRAKKILQEHRNDVFDAVMPMFDVRPRDKGDVWTAEDPKSKDGQSADKHAEDYIVRNLFADMVREYKNWMDEFVAPAVVETTVKILINSAETKALDLTAELRNYKFNFRDLSLPGKTS